VCLDVGNKHTNEISIGLTQRLAEHLHTCEHSMDLVMSLNLRIDEKAVVRIGVIHGAMISQGQGCENPIIGGTARGIYRFAICLAIPKQEIRRFIRGGEMVNSASRLGDPATM
jgi:hypothetical protein